MLLLCQKKNKTKPKTLLSFLFCSEIRNRETGQKQQVEKKENTFISLGLYFNSRHVQPERQSRQQTMCHIQLCWYHPWSLWRWGSIIEKVEMGRKNLRSFGYECECVESELSLNFEAINSDFSCGPPPPQERVLLWNSVFRPG